jgi:dephospho-CoA kinase
MITIGITGTLCAGKGAAVDYLEQKGFKHYSVRAFLAEEVKRRGLELNRDQMTIVANDLRAKYSSGYIIETIFAQVQTAASAGDGTEKGFIIESVRALGEVDFLQKQPHTVLLAVDADPKIRYNRCVSRASALDNVSFEKFISDERREISPDPTKGNLLGCIKRADFVIVNDGSLDALHAQIDAILPEILKK